MKNNEGGKTKKKGNGKQCREIPISFKIIVGREITIYTTSCEDSDQGSSIIRIRFYFVTGSGE